MAIIDPVEAKIVAKMAKIVLKSLAKIHLDRGQPFQRGSGGHRWTKMTGMVLLLTSKSLE